MSAQEADHIAIPLLDARHALAQIVWVNGSRALLYLTGHTRDTDAPMVAIFAGDVVAVLATDLSSLPEDHWRIIGYDAIADLGRTPVDLTNGATTVHDPAVIEAFANAIHGLYPWDGFGDPDFFTNMLSDPEKLPDGIRTSADFPKPDPAE